VTGATGYIGSRLVPLLVRRGHVVKALVRTGSEPRLPAQCERVEGDALRGGGYTDALRGMDTLVHLIGVAHPSPAKAREFRIIDGTSVEVALHSALTAGVKHFVYLSVAQPAPMMRDYVAVRAHCEALIRDSGIVATFVRPWYVLGPGHRWPIVLGPMYWLLEGIPATATMAGRLGLVTINQMLGALVWTVEHPPGEIRIMDVSAIRASVL
jgi:uncharacterized protein YbjT (DUF2867 family)